MQMRMVYLRSTWQTACMAAAALAAQACAGAPPDLSPSTSAESATSPSPPAAVATGAAPAAPALGPLLEAVDGKTGGESRLTMLLIAPPTDLRQQVAAFGPNCHPLPVSEIRATGSDPQGPLLAFDGNQNTAWNARGFAPQAISLRFPATSDVVGVLLMAQMHPASGPARHVLEPSSDGRLFAVGYVSEATMRSGALYAWILPKPMRTQHLRIRTVASPSWVAWREVLAFGCMGPVTIPPHAKLAPPFPTTQPAPPTQPPQLVFNSVGGGGACATDADCIPSSCCQPKSCINKQRAPRCDRVGCPAVVGPMDHPGAGCACREGRCGALLPAAKRPAPPAATVAKPTDKAPDCRRGCSKTDVLCQMRCAQYNHSHPRGRPKPGLGPTCGCKPSNLICVMRCKHNRK